MSSATFCSLFMLQHFVPFGLAFVESVSLKWVCSSVELGAGAESEPDFAFLRRSGTGVTIKQKN